MNAERLNEVLFELDPARTCCVENECYDEYISIAEAIVSFSDDDNLREIIKSTFMFDFDVELPNEMIEQILEEYENV